MMTSESVLAWLQTLPVRADNYYCGILDRKKEKSFGVYQLSRRKNETAVGGRDPTRTRTHGVSLLVHWNHSTRQTQNAAIALYEAIAAAGAAQIGSCRAAYFQMQQNEPIDVGVDDNGICEYVIEFVIYYEEETAWEQ